MLAQTAAHSPPSEPAPGLDRRQSWRTGSKSDTRGTALREITRPGRGQSRRTHESPSLRRACVAPAHRPSLIASAASALRAGSISIETRTQIRSWSLRRGERDLSNGGGGSGSGLVQKNSSRAQRDAAVVRSLGGEQAQPALGLNQSRLGARGVPGHGRATRSPGGTWS